VNGDGKLDATTVTREGWAFLWGTDASSCDTGSTTTNEEWWTFHHDEHGTANYGADARPPGSPEDLRATRHADADSATVGWTAPGDDWLCGTAERIRVLAADGPIEHPSDGDIVREEDAQAGAGEEVEIELEGEDLGDATHLAVLYRDDAGNWGRLAGAEIEGEAGPPAGPPAGPAAACANPISGTRARDKLTGTEAGDRIRSRGDRDKVDGAGGDDCLNGGRGRDRLTGGTGGDSIKGGRGRDRVRARDGEADVIRCGKGRDRVAADGEDTARGCEQVKRR
jgi:Ca2+-binding RTX toxin-like protein